MDKVILFNNEARDKLKRGVDLIANAIKVTLGPRGRNVIYGNHYGYPFVTKDGITVARQMECKDTNEQLGLLLVRQASQKTADDAGDGTTTVALLTQAIFAESLKVLGTGANPILIKRGLDSAAKEVVEFIKKNTVKNPSDEEIYRIATISANNDPVIGKLIFEAIQKAGKDGVITIENNYRDSSTHIETIEGMQLNEGYISPYFVTDVNRMEAVWNNPYILIADYEIGHIQPLMKAVELAMGENSEKRPLVIIANNITGQALATLVANRHKGGIPILACKAPYFGDNRTEQLTDLAILTGGRVVGNSSGLKFEDIDITDFGQVETIVATKSFTTFTGGRGSKEHIDARVQQLNKLASETESDYEKAKLQERLAKLTSGVAVIKVGASTEVESQEKKMRIEDALHATRAALEEGIVPGGGVLLLRAAKHLETFDFSFLEEDKIGNRILIKALQEPIKQIASNSGLDGSEIIAEIIQNDDVRYGFDFLNNTSGDLVKLGVIDPSKVVRLTVENAVSVAGMLMTTEVCIAEKEEVDPFRTPKPKSE